MFEGNPDQYPLQGHYRPRQAYALALRAYILSQPDLKAGVREIDRAFTERKKRGAWDQTATVVRLREGLIAEAAERYQKEHHVFKPAITPDDLHQAALEVLYEEVYEKRRLPLAKQPFTIKATATTVVLTGSDGKTVTHRVVSQKIGQNSKRVAASTRCTCRN